MKHVLLSGLLIAGLSSGAANAQAPAAPGGGHAAPKSQPAQAPAATAPSGQVALGTVTLPKTVKADGKELKAGTYQVRVTADAASPAAAGESKGTERWLEFLQGGQVKGREVVTIIPASEVTHVQKDTPPASGGSKFETLKGGDYTRLWINRGGTHYLVHFPA